jgi:thymidylate kinase
MSRTGTGQQDDILRAVEDAVARPVVLTSSGVGRDTDIVCRQPERVALQEMLETVGYRMRGRRLGRRAWTEQWVRFDVAGAYVVDLNPAERWGVHAEALALLFEDAEPLDGHENVRRAAAHHGLILLARRLGRGAGPLSAKQRSKVERIVNGDADAWRRAATSAEEWHCRAALDGLSRRYRGLGSTRRLRLRAGIEPAILGRGRLVRFVAAATVLPVPRRPMVIGFSGVDGSGKSTQIEALRATLDELGVPSRLAWKPVGHGAALRLVRRSIKRSLRARPAHPPSGRPTDVDAPALTWDPNPPSRQLRERSPALTSAWAVYVAVSTAAAYRGAELRCRLSRRTLICDRHSLDTDAHLVFQYGQARRPSVAIRLSDLVTPRADVAVHVEVPAEVARSRKPLQYTAEEVERLVAIYAEERSRLGVLRLDGTRTPDEIAEQIAQAVWKAS